MIVAQSNTLSDIFLISDSQSIIVDLGSEKFENDCDATFIASLRRKTDKGNFSGISYLIEFPVLSNRSNRFLISRRNLNKSNLVLKNDSIFREQTNNTLSRTIFLPSIFEEGWNKYEAAISNIKKSSHLEKPSIPPAYRKLFDKLRSYLELEEDWNGYGAVVPNSTVVNTAVEFAERLKENELRVPKPMLSSSGEVGLYYEKKDSFVNISFKEKGSFSYFATDDKDRIICDVNLPVNGNIPEELLDFIVKI